MKPIVLHVAAFRNAAGGGFTSALASLARRDEFETVLLCPYECAGYAWAHTLRESGVRLVHAGTQFDVAAAVVRTAPAVVHAHFMAWMLPATLGAAAARARTAWHLHSGVTQANSARDSARRLKYASAKRLVERFFCVSPDLVRYLQRYGVPAARITELPNGVDLRHFRPPNLRERAAARLRYGLAPHDRVLVFFGRDAAVKGADRLASAMGLLKHRPRLLLVAPSEESRRLLRDPRTIDAGSVLDIRQLLWAADALALPSRIETVTYALLEARACGLPAVASPLPGITGALSDDSGTLLADPENTAAFAAALDLALRRESTPLAPAVAERLSVDAWADRLVSWYAQRIAA